MKEYRWRQPDPQEFTGSSLCNDGTAHLFRTTAQRIGPKAVSGKWTGQLAGAIAAASRSMFRTRLSSSCATSAIGRQTTECARHYRGTPPESAAGVPEHALDSGVREEGSSLASSCASRPNSVSVQTPFLSGAVRIARAGVLASVLRGNCESYVQDTCVARCASGIYFLFCGNACSCGVRVLGY